MEKETEQLLVKRQPSCEQGKTWVFILVTVALVIVCVCTVAVLSASCSTGVAIQSSGRSSVGVYTRGAVVTDYKPCSKIASDIMQFDGGTAVDAAVAAQFCVGVVNIQASGIGGGHFSNIFLRSKDGSKSTAITINAREMAPSSADKNMFVNVTDPGLGPKAIGIPGEVLGLHKAWSVHGTLPWNVLIQPAIDIARSGFTISGVQENRINGVLPQLSKFPNLRSLLLKSNGEPYRAGDVMKRPLLARTLERIRDGGAKIFYSGDLADDILSDIREAGGNWTSNDLANYSTEMKPPLEAPLYGSRLLVPTLPSGGPITQFMLRVLEGFYPDSVSEVLKDDVNFHQIIIETFKFGFAMRSYLGDDAFVNVSEPMANITSKEFIRHIRSRVDVNHTHAISYYNAVYESTSDHGTSHLSVVSPDGSAVSLTASINKYFGSMVVGSRTGIIFNNEMNDFSTPGLINNWGVYPSSANFIAPGKRPLSSMSPAILVERYTDEPRLVIGGAGGSMISTILSLVIHLNQQLGVDLRRAIDFPRFHHQLLPNVCIYEPEVSKRALEGLFLKGHLLSSMPSMATINGIQRHCDVNSMCKLTAVGDVRREAQPYGWN